MDCPEILELIDAYALSATDDGENGSVEAHVADCARCWEELSKAQRTAALLTLGIPIGEAPPQLRDRILSQARRDLAGIRSEPRVPLFQRLRLGWPATATGLGVASVAALAFAGFLQSQVNDLRSQNESLESSVLEASLELERRDRQIETVSEAQDGLIRLIGATTSVDMLPVASNEPMTVAYSWSKDHRSGVVDCHNVPPPPEGKVYQIWYSAGGTRYPAASFVPQDGKCFVPVEVPADWKEPTGVGISIEDPEAIVSQPQDGWLAYAYLKKSD